MIRADAFVNDAPVSSINPLPVAGSIGGVPGDLIIGPVSATAIGELFSKDLSGFAGLSVQVISAGTATIVYEGSNDNVTFVGVDGLINNSSAASANTTNTVLTLYFEKKYRYYRVRVSAYTSGTVTIVAACLGSPLSSFVTVRSVGGFTAIQGQAVHDAAAILNPVLIGGRAKNIQPTPVADGDSSWMMCDTTGKIINKQYSPAEMDWSYVPPPAGINNTAIAVPIVGAPGAGLRNYITGITLQIVGVTVVTDFTVDSVTGAVSIFRMLMPAGNVGPIDINFTSPINGAVNDALQIRTVLAAGATSFVYANIRGYIAP